MSKLPALLPPLHYSYTKSHPVVLMVVVMVVVAVAFLFCIIGPKRSKRCSHLGIGKVTVADIHVYMVDHACEIHISMHMRTYVHTWIFRSICIHVPTNIMSLNAVDWNMTK